MTYTWQNNQLRVINLFGMGMVFQIPTSHHMKIDTKQQIKYFTNEKMYSYIVQHSETEVQS